MLDRLASFGRRLWTSGHTCCASASPMYTSTPSCTGAIKHAIGDAELSLYHAIGDAILRTSGSACCASGFADVYVDTFAYRCHCTLQMPSFMCKHTWHHTSITSFLVHSGHSVAIELLWGDC